MDKGISAPSDLWTGEPATIRLMDRGAPPPSDSQTRADCNNGQSTNGEDRKAISITSKSTEQANIFHPTGCEGLCRLSPVGNKFRQSLNLHQWVNKA